MLTHVLQPASLSAFNAASLSTSGAAPGSISSRKLSSKVTRAYRGRRPGFGFRPERPSSRCRQPRSSVWTQSTRRAPRPRTRGSGSRPPAASGQDDSVSRNPYLACPETGSQGRRGRCGAKASGSRASAPRRPRGNRPRKVPVARSASGFRFFGLFENQHRRPGRRAPRNPRQRLGTPAQGHGVARSGGGQRGAWARRGTQGLQRTRPMCKTDLPATGR